MTLLFTKKNNNYKYLSIPNNFLLSQRAENIKYVYAYRKKNT